MIRGYDSGRSHLLPFEATQHTKKGQTHIYTYTQVHSLTKSFSVLYSRESIRFSFFLDKWKSLSKAGLIEICRATWQNYLSMAVHAAPCNGISLLIFHPQLKRVFQNFRALAADVVVTLTASEHNLIATQWAWEAKSRPPINYKLDNHGLASNQEIQMSAAACCPLDCDIQNVI